MPPGAAGGGKARVIKLVAEIQAEVKDFNKGVERVEKRLQKLTKGVGGASAGIGDLEKESKTANRSMSAAAGSVSRLAKNLLGLQAAAVTATAAIGKLTQAGGRFVTVGDAFDRTAVGGRTSLNSMRSATRGLIDDFVLMEQFNRAVLLGAADTTAQFAEMAEVATILGRAVNEDAAFALESLTLGIGRQSRLFLDNLGLIIKVEEAYRRYAVAHGLVNEQLSEGQQKEAFRIEAMRKAKEEADRLGGIVLNAGDAFTQFATEIRNAEFALKAMLARSQGLKNLFTNLGRDIRTLTTGVSTGAQLVATQVGLEDSVDELKAMRDELRAIQAMMPFIVEPTRIEEIARGFGGAADAVGGFLERLSTAMTNLAQDPTGSLTPIRDLIDEMGELETRALSTSDSLRQLNIPQSVIDVLNEDFGIFTAMELFLAQGEQLGKLRRLFGDGIGLQDMAYLLDIIAARIEEVGESASSALDPKKIDPSVLSMRELSDELQSVAKNARSLEMQVAMAATTEEAEELESRLGGVTLQLNALREEMLRRGAGGSTILSDLRADRTITEVDNMRMELESFADLVNIAFGEEMPQSFADFIQGWQAMVSQVGEIEAIETRIEAVQNRMDALGRRDIVDREGYRRAASSLRMILAAATELNSETQEGTENWRATRDIIQEILDLLDEADDKSKSFFERLQIAFNKQFSVEGLKGILEGAFSNLLSGGVNAAMGFLGNAIGNLFKPSVVERNTLAIEQNTRAVLQSARRLAGGEVGGVRDAIDAAFATGQRGPFFFAELERQLRMVGLSVSDYGDLMEDLGLEFSHTEAAARQLRDLLASNLFRTFDGQIDLLRRKMDALDIEDPLEQFEMMRRILAQNVGGPLAGVLGMSNIENIGQLYDQIIGQLMRGEFDFSQLGDLSVDEFLDAIGELERLGDEAAEAAAGLSELSEQLRNVPTGFKTRFAQFSAAMGENQLANTLSHIDPHSQFSPPPGPFTLKGPGGMLEGGTTINIDQLTVVSDDPKRLFDEIGDMARRETRRGGTNDLVVATGGVRTKGPI